MHLQPSSSSSSSSATQSGVTPAPADETDASGRQLGVARPPKRGRRAHPVWRERRGAAARGRFWEGSHLPGAGQRPAPPGRSGTETGPGRGPPRRPRPLPRCTQAKWRRWRDGGGGRRRAIPASVPDCAVSRGQHPAAADQNRAAVMDAVGLEADLPGPRPRTRLRQVLRSGRADPRHPQAGRAREVPTDGLLPPPAPSLCGRGVTARSLGSRPTEADGGSRAYLRSA